MADKSLKRNLRPKIENQRPVRGNKKNVLGKPKTNEIKALHQSREENEIEINKLAQYNRSSFMLELSGIPQQNDENVIDLVNKTALAAGICKFYVSQTDIAHKVSDKETAPIIVLFNRKADKTNIYRQKNKLFKVQLTILLNLIITIIVIVKLIFQALREKIALYI